MIEVPMNSGEVTLDVKMGEFNEVFIDDYNRLKNLPRLNGQEIKGDMHEEDPTVPAWAKEENKPNYTASEVSAVPAENAITLAEIEEMFKAVFGE